jgi:hypothetical protein
MYTLICRNSVKICTFGLPNPYETTSCRSTMPPPLLGRTHVVAGVQMRRTARCEMHWPAPTDSSLISAPSLPAMKTTDALEITMTSCSLMLPKYTATGISIEGVLRTEGKQLSCHHCVGHTREEAYWAVTGRGGVCAVAKDGPREGIRALQEMVCCVWHFSEVDLAAQAMLCVHKPSLSSNVTARPTRVQNACESRNNLISCLRMWLS